MSKKIKRIVIPAIKKGTEPRVPVSAPAPVSPLLHDLRSCLNQIVGFTELVEEAVSGLMRQDLLSDLSRINNGIQQLRYFVESNLCELQDSTPKTTDWMHFRIAARGPINQILGYSEMIYEMVDEPVLAPCREDLKKVTLAAREFWKLVEPSSLHISQAALTNGPDFTKEVRLHVIRSVDGASCDGRILVIDDEAQNREILTRRLKAEGYQVEAVGDTDGAMAALAAQVFDLVLLDVLIPGKDGYTFLKELRQDSTKKELPVIMLSGVADVDRIAACIEAGADDYLTKPFNAVLLRARVAMCLEKKRLRDSEGMVLSRLREESERLNVTLSSIGEAVISTNMDGVITLFNHGAERMLGWLNREAMGKDLYAVVPLLSAEDGDPITNLQTTVIDCGSPVAFSSGLIVKNRDGKPIPVSVRAAPMRDVNGWIRGVVLVLHDGTERERFAQEILRSSKLESLSILAGGIAHEYNNILTSIFGHISLAQMEAVSEAVSYRLRATEEAAIRAKHLTRQLLTFARGGDPIRRTIRIDDVIRQAASFAVRNSKVQCEFSLPDILPAVDADPDQISQVIHNLVLNAEQAMNGEGVITLYACQEVLEAERGILKPGRYLRIAVHDTGIGIPESIITQIFDTFFTTKPHSSGLGLSAAYSIIRKHSGAIEVSSVPAEETTFHVWIPLASVADEIAPGSVPTPFGARILVIDDEEQIREVLQGVLELAGYEIEVAKEGKEALEKYDHAVSINRPFDMIIMDLVMPNGMGGREAIIHVRERDALIPVLVSSGYSNDPVMARFQDFGFSGVLPKPYRMRDLLHAMAILIHKART